MPSPTSIASDKLARLIGLPHGPAVIDVRTSEDFASDPRLIPGAIRASHADIREWAQDATRRLAGRSAVIVCHQGRKLSEGVAAWLRHCGGAAETLSGGHVAWAKAGLPLIAEAKLPPRDAQGRTLWVTRARPKIDRIACPWLIRRFVDPNAVFLFVAASEVSAVAERFGATPFDVEGVEWSHRGELCTFDVMIAEWGLRIDALSRLAAIVRGAGTGRLDLAPEAAGLLAASLGLSRMFSDDLAQLDAGLTLYDAFYRWARDATDETHGWPSVKPGKST